MYLEQAVQVRVLPLTVGRALGRHLVHAEPVVPQRPQPAYLLEHALQPLVIES